MFKEKTKEDNPVNSNHYNLKNMETINVLKEILVKEFEVK